MRALKLSPLSLGALLLILSACADVPVKSEVDLDRVGVALRKQISFERSDQYRYVYGFLFRPTFVSGDTWHLAQFYEEKQRAWDELCAEVRIEIRDSKGAVRMSDSGAISEATGWSMSGGSQEADFPATVSKDLPFKPRPGERYTVTVEVMASCPQIGRVSPHFVIFEPVGTL